MINPKRVEQLIRWSIVYSGQGVPAEAALLMMHIKEDEERTFIQGIYGQDVEETNEILKERNYKLPKLPSSRQQFTVLHTRNPGSPGPPGDIGWEMQ